MLNAAAKRLQVNVGTALENAYRMRAMEWGMTRFELARRADKPQPMLERIFTGHAMGLRMIGMISYACDAELDFKLLPREQIGEAE